DGFSFKASKVVVTKRDSFGVWGHLDSGGETSNVYAGESVTIEGDLTVSFGSFPGEIEFRNGKALVQRAKVSSVGAVKFSGDLEASDTLGGPKDPKAMIEAPGSASYSVVWGEVEVPSSFRVTSRDAEFNGTLDFEGKKTLTGKIGLAGGDVEFFNGILEGQASQVYLNGLPQLEASLAVEPKTLCYTATRGKRVLIPLALKESSGNTTADNLKVSLFTEKGNALGVAVHEGIGDVLFDLFTAAFTFGLSLFVDEPRSLSPNGSMQLDLVSNSPLESEQKAVLMVACDNCESLQVPVIIRPS
ncbi:MAG TPA: hypothetical protein VJI67_04280, partial [archaeon]|nr:hypothetical protein [archaeon]